MDLLQEEWIKGTNVRIGTYKIQLPGAIGNVGNYYYRLVMKNNAYFGCDVDIPIDLEVTPVSIGKSLAGLKKKFDEEDESEDSESDSDISDPEEDSLAGAIAALRGSDLKKKKSSQDELEEESEDEEVFTDINTDTEDEGDN